MPHAKPNRDLQEIEHETQRDILYALTDPDDNQPLWSLEDLPARWETPASSTPSTLCIAPDSSPAPQRATCSPPAPPSARSRSSGAWDSCPRPTFARL
jgi:hypothetical protein